MRFVVLQARNVTPVGATGARTWIFEKQQKTTYLLEGLAGGGYARVRLHWTGSTYVGTVRLHPACLNHPSVRVVDTSHYSVRITRSGFRSGHRVALAITAYLSDTFSPGCDPSGGSDLRRYMACADVD
jgi:hypothetical protein